MHKLFALLLSLTCVFASPLASAESAAAPDALVKSVTTEVLSIIRQDKDIQAGSTTRAVELIEQKVLPHFNFLRMTALAMGKEWRQATPEQQKALAEEFRLLLVRTYSTALTQYRDQTIDFKPLRMQPGDTDVLVRSAVKQPGGKPIAIDYNLEKSSDAWKVYDIIVDGVSMVTNYRSEFTAEVRNGGIDGLLKSLQAKNRAPASAQSVKQ